ncbi:hypothetical protein ABE488_09490 [Luteimonas sp. TWI662]|uniref:hypothetical protein n=1 Tax=Luteimonas sp. TWI662 TaxID=3136789 RepID=UPI003208CA90
MTSPKISLNKLGEYLTASPARRRRIVHDQKDPRPFITARYMDAREVIVDFLASGKTDDNKLVMRAKALRSDSSGTEFARQDRIASADAIESFLEVADQIELADLEVVPLDNSTSAEMQIEGVSVSVRPDVLFKDAMTKDVVGAVKLHFPKSTPLNENAAKYVSTTLRVYLTDELNSVTADHRKCYVVDVSTQTVTCAPKSFKKNMSDVAAACEEIRARWELGA